MSTATKLVIQAPKRINKHLENKKFNRWLVLERGHKINRRWTWLCKCDCGTVRYVLGCSLGNSRSQSCGCLQRERASEQHRKPIEQVKTSAIYHVINDNSKQRGIEFSIDPSVVYMLSQQNCFYCNSKPTNTINNRHNKRPPIYYSGLDRVDNSMGYRLSNVVPCCIKCNRAKSHYNIEDFKLWIKQAYNHLYGSKDSISTLD